MKIAIRGGHNYGVTGASGIVSEVVEDRKYYKAVADYLNRAGHEVIDVTPERTSTKLEDLSYGVNKANAADVDLFVSCHINAYNGLAHGCEVLFYGTSVKGKEFASKVVNSIAGLGFDNRGAQADVRGLYELRRTNMPAIIIEPFFCDNKADVDLYNNVGFDKLGQVIAEAIHGSPIEIAPPYPGYLIKYSPSHFDANVKLAQEKLGILADGLFGNKTLAAVQSFQKSKGLQPDGIVGPITWKALFN